MALAEQHTLQASTSFSSTDTSREAKILQYLIHNSNPTSLVQKLLSATQSRNGHTSDELQALISALVGVGLDRRIAVAQRAVEDQTPRHCVRCHSTYLERENRSDACVVEGLKVSTVAPERNVPTTGSSRRSAGSTSSGARKAQLRTTARHTTSAGSLAGRSSKAIRSCDEWGCIKVDAPELQERPQDTRIELPSVAVPAALAPALPPREPPISFPSRVGSQGPADSRRNLAETDPPAGPGISSDNWESMAAAANASATIWGDASAIDETSHQMNGRSFFHPSNASASPPAPAAPQLPPVIFTPPMRVEEQEISPSTTTSFTNISPPPAYSYEPSRSETIALSWSDSSSSVSLTIDFMDWVNYRRSIPACFRPVLPTVDSEGNVYAPLRRHGAAPNVDSEGTWSGGGGGWRDLPLVVWGPEELASQLSECDEEDECLVMPGSWVS